MPSPDTPFQKISSTSARMSAQGAAAAKDNGQRNHDGHDDSGQAGTFEFFSHDQRRTSSSFCLSSPSILAQLLPRPPGASAGLPAGCLSTSSRVEMSCWLVWSSVSMSTMPRSDSLGGLDRSHLERFGVLCAAARWSCRTPRAAPRMACCEWASAERQHHLALPQGNGVDQGGSESFPPSGCRCPGPGESAAPSEWRSSASVPGRAASFQTGCTWTARSLAACASSGRPDWLGLFNQLRAALSLLHLARASSCPPECTWTAPCN